jgi:hypothetical protein
VTPKTKGQGYARNRDLDRVAQALRVSQMGLTQGARRKSFYGGSTLVVPPVARASRQLSAAAPAPQPFQVTLRADPEDETVLLATVWPGTVNGVLPTNYTVEAELDVASSYYLVLEITTATASVTGVTIAAPSTIPDTQIPTTINQPPTSFKILFAIVAEGVLFQIRTGNVFVVAREELRVAKSVAAGEIPWDSYWTWGIPDGNIF